MLHWDGPGLVKKQPAPWCGCNPTGASAYLRLTERTRKEVPRLQALPELCFFLTALHHCCDLSLTEVPTMREKGSEAGTPSYPELHPHPLCKHWSHVS